MSASEPRYWLEDGGTRVEIHGGGVLIGRGADCDIVIPDPYVSRHHALVRLAGQLPELFVMGRRAVAINGEPAAARMVLSAGDRLSIADRELRVVTGAAAADLAEPSFWLIEYEPGKLYGMARMPFQVGGGAGDDLVIPGWPDAAAALYAVQGGRLLIEARVAATLGGKELGPGAVERVGHGDELAVAGITLRFINLAGSVQHTTRSDEGEVAALVAVRLQFLPRGGRLFLTYTPDDTRAIYLAEKRCALIGGLLQQPGQLLSDEEVCARVWPRDDGKSRLDVNTLVFRVRGDLAKAGIDGATLIERDAGGTRFAVQSRTQVEIG